MKNTTVNFGEYCYIIQNKCNTNDCEKCDELTQPDKQQSLFNF